MTDIKLDDTDMDEISQTIKNQGIEGFNYNNEQIAIIANVIKNQTQKANQPTPKRKLNVGQSYDELEQEIAKLEAIPDIKTGFNELDQKVKLSAGTLSVIYAYSGHGKTSFMLKLMQSFMNNNSPNDVACMYILFEDATPRIKQRFKNTFIKSENEYQSRMKINSYSDDNSYCFEHAYEGEDALRVEDLESELIAPFKELNKNKTIVVFVDYIQQIDIKDKKQSGYDKMKTISKELKRIASIKDEEIIVIAGAQENKEGGLREADDIRQSADNIINLYNVSAAEAELDKAIKKRQLTTEQEETAKDLKNDNKSLVLLHIVKTRNTDGKGACDNGFAFDGNNFIELYHGGYKQKEITNEIKEENDRLKKEDIRTNAYGTGNIKRY
jgi:replicative DNA helicase